MYGFQAILGKCWSIICIYIFLSNKRVHSESHNHILVTYKRTTHGNSFIFKILKWHKAYVWYFTKRICDSLFHPQDSLNSNSIEVQSSWPDSSALGKQSVSWFWNRLNTYQDLFTSLLWLRSREQIPSECYNRTRQGKWITLFHCWPFPLYWDMISKMSQFVLWFWLRHRIKRISQGKQQNVMVLQLCIFTPLSLL